MDFRDLLNLHDVPETAKIKLYRHSDAEVPLDEFHANGNLEEYQRHQIERRFECDLVAFFLGMERNQSLFTGFYKPTGCTEVEDFEAKAAASDLPSWMFSRFRYDLEPQFYLQDLKKRLVLDFGQPSRAHHRWIDSFKVLPVVEIRPKGRYKPFPGYQSVKLSFSQLSNILANPSANQDWKNALSAVAGVYVICVNDASVQPKTGHLYVGSAYGKENLWQRFGNYASTRHGGNKGLVDLLETRADAYLTFQFSILQTLPTTATKDEVIALENIYKDKLGTRQFGLNHN